MARGEKAKGVWRDLRWARRAVQTASLLLFLALIAATASLAGGGFDASSSGRVPYPVEVYLDIDPFVGALVALSAHALPGALVFSGIVLATALFLGRGFCGWICPFGAMHHGISHAPPKKPARRRIEANRPRPYQKIKYVVLVVSLVAAAFGSGLGGLVDPISLATRGVSLTIVPWLNYLLGGALSAGAGSDVAALRGASDALYEAASGVAVYQRGFIVGGGVLVAIVFIAALVVNRFIPRFFCRAICPLGAMLGATGRFGALSLVKDEEACDGCNLCELHCAQAASPKPGEPWRRAECDLCMNCVAACPKNALKFGLAGRETNELVAPDVERRKLLAGAALGAVIVPALRTGTLTSPLGRPDPACIRPPGAVDEEEFLARCVRCGQCMKICPNNALHPALDEAGIEGLWTPVLVPRVGYCEPTCTLCTQVCPTAALRRVHENEKTGNGGAAAVRLGTAFFDQGRCLPWSMGVACTVCEEFCPTSPKAIRTRETEIQIDGRAVTLKVPHVDPRHCIGCGACEHVCPVRDKAAIRVTSAGESRSPRSKLLL
jgi:MauM/NapG family ferredoxin protein